MTTSTLAKLARSDMRKARLEGSILITQTRWGLIELEYIRDRRLYRIARQGTETFPGGIRAHKFTAAGCENFLVDAFQIVF
jgi:hypothetical protein